MKTSISQLLSFSSFYSDWRHFTGSFNELEKIQQGVLRECLKGHPYLSGEREFRNSPIQNYEEFSKNILNFKYPDFVRNQPTSGSGSQEKVIPYTERLIKQFQRGLNPWLFELFRHHPKALFGKHYWSLSWLPDHWREKGWMLDDSELLPSWKRTFLKNILACPSELSRARTLEATQFATLTFLVAAKDLSFISVWSPTFMLEHLKLLTEWKEELASTLESGKWEMFREELSIIKPPHCPARARSLRNSGQNYHVLWPYLSLLSSWQSSTSKGWAEELMSHFPKASFSPKGLWATEGVISIPFQNKQVLAFHSHYYEFKNLQSGSIQMAHQLKEGDEFYPLLTTVNGLVRYCLEDRVRVTGHIGKVPCLEFIGRDGTLDLAGEKLTLESLHRIVQELERDFPAIPFISAFAVNDPKKGRPHYLFLFQGQDYNKKLETRISGLLSQHFHYQLARELGQLGEETIVLKTDAMRRYNSFQSRRGMVAGNIKPEVARVVSNHQEVELLYECLT